MIYVICGQTASGKSGLALEFAKKVNGVIVNADAFQVYKELDIGTAKPTIEERQIVPHYLFDQCLISEEYHVKRYQEEARELIKQLTKEGKAIIFVGGTGLYIRSVFYDYKFIDHPIIDMSEYDSYTNDELYEYLLKIDKDAAFKTHPQNRRRVLRAIEIYKSSGLTKSEIEAKQSKELLFDVVFVGISLSKDELEQRIDRRVEEMFCNGLLSEIKQLLSKYNSSSPAFKAIGYEEVIKNKNMSEEELKQLIKLRTRQYAKRQNTFFKHQLPVKWFNNSNEALSFLIKKYKECKNEKVRTN